MVKFQKLSKSKFQNLSLYLFFLFIAFIGILYGNSIKSNFLFLRIWDPINLAFLALGFPFLIIQRKTGIPDFLEKRISNNSRFLQPIIIGFLFGLLDIFVFKIILHPQPYEELPPFLQPFPYSLFLFFSGALEIEVFYRLIPLSLFLIFGNWFFQGKYHTTFFVIGAILTSIREPLEQLPQGSLILIIYCFTSGFIMNYIQAIYIKKYGFLATFSIRLSHYFLWHILLGIYVQFIELS